MMLNRNQVPLVRVNASVYTVGGELVLFEKCFQGLRRRHENGLLVDVFQAF